MHRSKLLIALVFACATVVHSQPPHGDGDADPGGELRFAFWNVENLFDCRDDPHNGGDNAYLPERGWTEQRYATKLDHLAEVIAAVAPHLLGLAEVENRAVVADLCAHPKLQSLGYHIVHRDSRDHRGIDLALLYRAPFVAPDEVLSVVLHPTTAAGNSRSRGILEVGLKVGEQPLVVLLHHWPSRLGKPDGDRPANDSYRRVAGSTSRAIVDRISAEAAKDDREADILLLGDFNDNPYDPSVEFALGAVRSRNAVLERKRERQLFNPSWSLLSEPDRGTSYYNRDWTWQVFDQAIVSKGMLDSRGFAYVEGSFDIHAPDQLRDRYRRPLRFRADRDGNWTEGYSDHFMIHGRLRCFDATGD